MRKFLSFTLLFFIGQLIVGCQSESSSQRIELLSPSGEVIQTRLAITPAEQEQGLSGIRPEDFNQNEGLLFFNLYDEEKHFWMPDTYFDLDLIYLDKELKILDIVRKLPHYKGRANPNLIPRARGVWCRHVLEMRADSPISNKLKVGDYLRLKTPTTLLQIESSIRQQL